MPVNYARMAATAARLISENGRLVSLRKLDQTPADADKPWNGPGTAHTTLDASAVLLPFEVEDVDGLIVKRGDNYAYVAASGIAQDLTLFEELVDAITGTWHVKKVALLNPGSTALLYTLHLTR